MFTKFMQLILTINFAHQENTEYGKITLIMVQLNVLVSRRQNGKEKIVLFYFIGVTQSTSTNYNTHSVDVDQCGYILHSK